ncbi:MAG: alpha/beta hydrolase [Sphingomicrobium sp.]
MLARLFLIVALAVQFPATVAAQYVVTHPSVVRLYPDGAPGSQSRRNEPEQAQDYWVKNIHDPTLTVYRADPAHASGASVIIFPGGGHSLLVFANEGAKGAEVLNRMGITAFVLKYRLAREPGSTYTIEGDAAGDASRSVKWVRAHAAQYGLDPRRIGVMGFSAGGELASLVANYPTEYAKAPRDALSNVSARPDFQILVFPGPLAVKSAIRPDAPPAFLVAGSRDECCGPPTVALYELLTNAKVSAELHMYAKAGHAFNIDETNRISVLHWPDRLFEWMSDSGLLDDRSKRGR